MKKFGFLTLLIMTTLVFTLAFPAAAAGPKAPTPPVPAVPGVAPVPAVQCERRCPRQDSFRRFRRTRPTPTRTIRLRRSSASSSRPTPTEPSPGSGSTRARPIPAPTSATCGRAAGRCSPRAPRSSPSGEKVEAAAARIWLGGKNDFSRSH